ncbi:MAG: hypothetical protein ETSY1_02585 [Candidatus Entotheonella factor]|uniref:Uncharacterized protein n=1 Tax=Entotheonella factor TaxID=1429438 RepID=W4LZC8_ENTF1|nr:MAG: hypothetical protein ETSY1_02585 [Candidatus Entotheonella factor]
MAVDNHVDIRLKHQSKVGMAQAWAVLVIIVIMGLVADRIAAEPFSQFVVFGWCQDTFAKVSSNRSLT